MQLNLKNFFLILIISSGFFIFLSNILQLNIYNKKIILSEINGEKQDPIYTDNIEKKNIETKILSENKTKDNTIENLQEIIIKVKKGQTFSQILDNFNLSNEKKFEIINIINKEFDLRELKINQKIFFYIDKNNKVKEIIIKLNFKTNLNIYLDSKIILKKEELKTFTNIESNEYIIKNSLYSDGINNNLPNQILVKLIKLFSFDLDFQRDIKEGTLVSVSYNKTNVENNSDYSFGDIEYARIKINKNNLEYFKFETDDGFIDYFNREGKNVKKSILKTPLDGAKLSSSFGMRKHPISGFNKMHKGIDFAAPKGTPIYAGGNGVIEFAGRNGGYGKYIRIRHNNQYKTAYAHLSGFKKGISKGIRVNQGDIIGYVGSTGRSTGPHLHYEIIYQNKQINPLTLKLPSGKILEGDEFKKFEKNYKIILANHLNNLYE